MRWEARELKWPIFQGVHSLAKSTKVKVRKQGNWLPERTGTLVVPREPQGLLIMSEPNA